MSRLLIEIFNMSITASSVAIIVVLIRLIIQKAPKKYSYMLWIIVFFRFICPITFQLPVSVNPVQPQTIPQDVVYSPNPTIQSGLPIVDNVVNNVMEQTLPPINPVSSINPIQIIVEILSYLWIIGVLTLLLYCFIIYLRFKKKINTAIRLYDNIYETDLIKTPFVLGLIKPRIYIPMELNKKELDYIIKHEQTHIKRFDYLIKPMAFVIVAVHWFNPIVWISYVLMTKDMELSADESVMLNSNLDIRNDYSNSLLKLSMKKSGLFIPLAFGETGLKARVKNVLNYKKPRFWVSIITAFIVITSSLLLVASKDTETTLENEIIASQDKEPENTNIVNPKEEFTTDTTTLPAQTNDNNINSTLDNEYTYSSNGKKYYTPYNKVKITFDTGSVGIDSEDIQSIFKTTDSIIISFIDNKLNTYSLITVKDADIHNNYTNKYVIEMSGKTDSYEYNIYYDTLNNKAYLEWNSDLYEFETDFARYIASLIEHKNINTNMERSTVVLFKNHGWTLDYQIENDRKSYKLGLPTSLLTFNSSIYYFMYNNELSKDIGFDMSTYTGEVDIEIYRIHESMPQEFYPVQDARGIIIKSDGKIIGAYISAGRHSTFNACSLKCNSFETATNKTLNEWFADNIIADPIDNMLSELTPEQVIEEYFKAINNLDVKTARASVSRKTLLKNLTANIPNNELYNEGFGLPLTSDSLGAKSSFDNLISAKLIDILLINEVDKDTKIYQVTVNLQYHKELGISNGEQTWNCVMTYETPQTGWKIEEFGH